MLDIKTKTRLVFMKKKGGGRIKYIKVKPKITYLSIAKNFNKK